MRGKAKGPRVAPASGPREWLTVNEVADTIGVARRTVDYWIRAGRLPATKFGNLWRIKASDLDKGTLPAEPEPEQG